MADLITNRTTNGLSDAVECTGTINLLARGTFAQCEVLMASASDGDFGSIGVVFTGESGKIIDGLGTYFLKTRTSLAQSNTNQTIEILTE